MGWYTDLVRKERDLEIAEKMIEYGESVEKITQLLNLSVKEVMELMKNMQNENANTAKNEEKPTDNEQ